MQAKARLRQELRATMRAILDQANALDQNFDALKIDLIGFSVQ